MEKISEADGERITNEILEILGKNVRTTQGGIYLLRLTIVGLMKRLPAKDKEEIRQPILNAVRAC